MILTPDEYDDRWVVEKNQHTDFYGLSAFAYESGYIGFLWVFRITDGVNDGPIFCELVSSRDGVNWTRQETASGRPPILPLGPRGAWDAGMVFTPNHPLVEGGTIKLWYGGIAATHGAPDGDNRSGIGLATLRKDGFASLDAGDVAGTVTTRLLNGARGALRVNADASRGELRVEVLDAKGRVLPGYGREDSVPITADGVNTVVKWRDHRALPDANQSLALRFVMRRASIYSFMAGNEVRIARPESPRRLLLTFDREAPVTADRGFVTHEHQLAGPGGVRATPYLVLEPPKDATRLSVGGRRPLLIALYGSGGSLDDYNIGSPPFAMLRSLLAERGYYVLAPDLGSNNWMNDTAKSALDGIVAKVLKAYPVDRARVHIIGTSMGGYGALAYTVHQPDLIRSVCDHIGVTDPATWFKANPNYFDVVTHALGGAPDKAPDAYRRNSAIDHARVFEHIPMLMIYGDSDAIVPLQQGRMLAHALLDRGCPVTYHEVIGGQHANESIQGYEQEIVEFFDSAGGASKPFRLRGDAALRREGDATVVEFGSGGGQGAIVIPGTMRLGRRFTLAASVKTSNRGSTRLFSCYRGTGPFVSGELVLDFDPMSGLRLVVNGQIAESPTERFDDGKWHHLAITYADGSVAFYLDGRAVGSARVEIGGVHLAGVSDVRRYFARAGDFPDAGIHLGDDLRVGGDAGGRFVTYRDEAFGKHEAALVGQVDDVLVARSLLAPAQMRRLAERRAR